jgi:hypothetical protein
MDPIAGTANALVAQGDVLGVIEDAGIVAGPERRRGNRERPVVELARVLHGHLAES